MPTLHTLPQAEQLSLIDQGSQEMPPKEQAEARTDTVELHEKENLSTSETIGKVAIEDEVDRLNDVGVPRTIARERIGGTALSQPRNLRRHPRTTRRTRRVYGHSREKARSWEEQ